MTPAPTCSSAGSSCRRIFQKGPTPLQKTKPGGGKSIMTRGLKSRCTPSTSSTRSISGGGQPGNPQAPGAHASVPKESGAGAREEEKEYVQRSCARGSKGICAFWPTLLTDEEKARRADWCSAQGRRDDACGLANGSCLHTDLPPGIPVRTNSKVHRVTPRREVVMVIS